MLRRNTPCHQTDQIRNSKDIRNHEAALVLKTTSNHCVFHSFVIDDFHPLFQVFSHTIKNLSLRLLWNHLLILFLSTPWLSGKKYF